jgi:hypothetical protein
MNTPLIRPVAPRAFAPLRVKRRIQSAPAPDAVGVHVLARADENHRALSDVVVSAVLRTGLGSGHITPRGVAPETRCLRVSTPVESVAYGHHVYVAQLLSSDVNPCVCSRLRQSSFRRRWPDPRGRSGSEGSRRSARRRQGGRSGDSPRWCGAPGSHAKPLLAEKRTRARALLASTGSGSTS